MTPIIRGGLGASSYRYYASDEYHSHPPKILIWEIIPSSSYNDHDATDAFRQMIPAIHGACSPKETLATYSTDITSLKTKFFDFRKKMNKSPNLRDTYLYFELTDPVDRQDLKMQILYANGDADDVKMTRTTYAANNGKYFLEMGITTDQPPMFFNLVTDKPQGHFNIRICPYKQPLVEPPPPPPAHQYSPNHS